MNKLLIAFLAVFALAGCSTPSTIILNDDTEIETGDTPDFNKNTGFYEYEDAAGKSHTINKDDVKQIKEM